MLESSDMVLYLTGVNKDVGLQTAGNNQWTVTRF